MQLSDVKATGFVFTQIMNGEYVALEFTVTCQHFLQACFHSNSSPLNLNIELSVIEEVSSLLLSPTLGSTLVSRTILFLDHKYI